jgi:hypothetical protein
MVRETGILACRCNGPITLGNAWLSLITRPRAHDIADPEAEELLRDVQVDRLESQRAAALAALIKPEVPTAAGSTAANTDSSSADVAVPAAAAAANGKKKRANVKSEVPGPVQLLQSCMTGM